MSIATRRGRLVAVGVALAALALGGCGAFDGEDQRSGTEETVTLRLAYLGVASWLPAMVAEEEGYFAEEGLDVESTIVANLATLPGAMGRQFDIAATTVPDTIRAQDNGIGVTIVANEAWETEESSVVRLLASPDSGIESIADLEGRRVAAGTLGGNIHPATLEWLTEAGLDVDAVTFAEIPFPQQQAQLSAGSVDAVEALEPFASAMKADGALDLGSPLLALGERVSISSWMAETSWAQENADVVERFVAALERAKAFIEQDESAARRILQQRTEFPEAVAQSVALPEFAFELDDADERLWQEVVDAQG